MPIGKTPRRFYPQHEVKTSEGQTIPVDPAKLNSHLRFVMDNVYDVQSAVRQMMGNPVIITGLTAGAVSSLTIAFPAFGFPDGTYDIVFSGGGGSGVKGKATASGGKIVSVSLTAGGAGYTTPPTATVNLP